MKLISDCSTLCHLARGAATAPLCLVLLTGFANAQESGADNKAASPPASDGAAPAVPVLQTRLEKLSYVLGMNAGKSYRLQAVEVDTGRFQQGLKDALTDAKPQVTDEEFAFLWNEFQNEMKQRAEAMKKTLYAERLRAENMRAEKNKADGEAFLAENKTREGVVALESGLQYKILKEGDGQKPTLNDTVVCHYQGTLLDGTEFDSSYKRNQPASLPLKNVIKGWAQALPLMPVGSKWQLVVPPQLAYGPRAAGKGKIIEPNSTLIFEIELLSIKEKVTARNRARTKASVSEQAEPLETRPAAAPTVSASKTEGDSAAGAANLEH